MSATMPIPAPSPIPDADSRTQLTRESDETLFDAESPEPRSTTLRERLSGTTTYTCGGCDNRWPGVTRCHCESCHQTFNGINLFDRHRRERNGDGYCVDPVTIVARKTGEREMFLTNGIWQSVENPRLRVPPKRPAT